MTSLLSCPQGHQLAKGTAMRKEIVEAAMVALFE